MPAEYRFDDLDLREEPDHGSAQRTQPYPTTTWVCRAQLSDNPQCCSKGTLTLG
ncbi:MAG: hypothetical protein QOI11_1207 [Candidatus Eremiobacteraeota bacterium]|jgi:hypothetical protein|nr:hypothetical protein [Candidatus Eremiobacteraeota bacterium]